MKVTEALSQQEGLENGMKMRQFEAGLNDRKLNASFAIVMIQAVQAYLRGDVDDTVGQLSTVLDELASRNPEVRPALSGGNVT